MCVYLSVRHFIADLLDIMPHTPLTRILTRHPLPPSPLSHREPSAIESVSQSVQSDCHAPELIPWPTLPWPWPVAMSVGLSVAREGGRANLLAYKSRVSGVIVAPASLVRPPALPRIPHHRHHQFTPLPPINAVVDPCRRRRRRRLVSAQSEKVEGKT